MLAFILSFALWSIVHSLTAAAGFKSWVQKTAGEALFQGFYRLGYNLLALFSFLPVAYFWLNLPNQVLWQIPNPINYLFYLVQVLAVVGATYSLWVTDVWDFVGVQQVVQFFRPDLKAAGNAPQLTHTLVVTGLYAYMRHPLYTFSLLLIWANPTLTLNTLWLNLALTTYFVVGSVFEEQRLEAKFGSAYQQYKSQVARFIPKIW